LAARRGLSRCGCQEQRKRGAESGQWKLPERVPDERGRGYLLHKFGLDPKIDDNPYNKVVPPADLLYVGWTEPGEWFNLTVDVAHAGEYSADLLYTSNRGGTISIDVNGKAATVR